MYPVKYAKEFSSLFKNGKISTRPGIPPTRVLPDTQQKAYFLKGLFCLPIMIDPAYSYGHNLK